MLQSMQFATPTAFVEPQSNAVFPLHQHDQGVATTLLSYISQRHSYDSLIAAAVLTCYLFKSRVPISHIRVLEKEASYVGSPSIDAMVTKAKQGAFFPESLLVCDRPI